MVRKRAADIKQAVIESCSLRYPDNDKTLVIETDASDYGWGSALYQNGADKVIEPIAFMDRKFSAAALKWYTTAYWSTTDITMTESPDSLAQKVDPIRS